MNTKVERERLIDDAKASITLDANGDIVGGFTPAWQAFGAKHGISEYRARQYVAKAARLLRGECLPRLGRPGERGVEVTVYLAQEQADRARSLGAGNVSAGVRLALEQAQRYPHSEE